MYYKIEVSRIIQNLPNYDNVSGEIRKKLRDFFSSYKVAL